MTNRLRGVAAAAACALTLVLAGCGGSDAAGPEHGQAGHDMADMEGMEGMEGMDQGGGAAAGGDAAAGGGHSGHGGAPGEVELWAVQTKPLGVIVTVGSGEIVYRSDKDTNQPPTTTCVDAACTGAWAPVVVTDQPAVGLGVTDTDIGYLARPDGTKQVTIAGWPIYTHVGESTGLDSAGGNGADGVWWAISPTGGKALPAGS